MKKYSNTIRNVVRSLFFVFSFFYIIYFQRSLIENYLDAYSSSVTGFSRMLFLAILLSIALTLISNLFEKLFKFSDGLYACSYLPSAFLLGVCTCFCKMSGKPFPIGTCILIAIVTILYMFICKVITVRKDRRGLDVSALYANNLLVFMYAMLCTFLLGNTDETLHRTLTMEKYYEQEKYNKVLLVGKNADEINTEISVLRAKSLSHMNSEVTIPGSQLGDHLFDYKQFDAAIVADTLLSMSVQNSSLELANRRLTSYLLRKNLNDFSDNLQDDLINELNISSWYPNDMPLYYLQALLLTEYKGISIPQEIDDLYPEQCKTQRALFAEYIKDKELVRSKSMQYRSNYMYKKYDKTYWWFYDFYK